MDKVYRYSTKRQCQGWLIILLGLGFLAMNGYVFAKSERDVFEWLRLLGMSALGAFILIWGLDTVLGRIKIEESAFWRLGPIVRRCVPYASVERLEEIYDNAPQRVFRGHQLQIRLKGREQALAIYHVDDLVHYDDLVRELENRTRLRVKRRTHAAPTMAT